MHRLAYGWVAQCLVNLLNVGYDMLVQRFEHGEGAAMNSRDIEDIVRAC